MTVEYIYEKKEWPNWTWDNNLITPFLSRVRHKQGLLYGRMQGLGFELQKEASLEVLTADIVKSAKIEGEVLVDSEVRSSITRHLGMNVAGLVPSSRNIDGFVQLVLDATSNYQEKLTKERLFTWHKSLFAEMHDRPHIFSNIKIIGNFRDDKDGRMQVISGGLGREKVHYQAPKAENLDKEISLFLECFNRQGSEDLVIKASIAHLWFVTLHPFEDGNGRITRALTDVLLARSDKSSERFYSMSSAIEKNRNAYYDILEKTQKGSLDITSWIVWFLECLEQAVDSANELLEKILNKAAFWQKGNNFELNSRQQLILNLLLDNFEGKLTSSKYAKLAKCSQDTALRDLKLLLEFKLIKKSNEGGRSTSYELVL